MRKQGLSTIITTLIIILMVLVAVGIVWYAILPMIKSGSQQVNYANKCLGIDFKASLVNCNEEGDGSWNCEISIKREPTSSSGEIEGVELVLSDDDGANEEIGFFMGNVITEKTINTNTLFTENEEPLGDLTFEPKRITRVRAYFIDDNDEKYFCPATQ